MKLEIFFDYNCPYCQQGHDALKDLLPEFPGLQIQWRPCEAHPRPETHGLHSDLCARGMYQAVSQEAERYHEIMYRACLRDHVNIEDLEIISGLVKEFTDTAAFRDALQSGAFQAELDDNNREAWVIEEFSAVPSLRMNGKTLAAVPHVGLTKEKIRHFIESNT